MEFTKEQLELALMPRQIQFYSTVESTNSVAQQWLHDDAPDGGTVIADAQTQGRGRLGRTWETPPQSALAVSVVLRHVKPATLSRVGMAASLAVFDMLGALGTLENVAIKWPNDVHINGQKVAGILPETVWDGDKLAGVILGMGINVTPESVPETLKGTATAIAHHTVLPLNRVSLLVVLLFRLDMWLAMLSSEKLVQAYTQHMPMLGQSIELVQHDGTVIAGVAERVDVDGALWLKTDTGSQRFFSGDVTVSRKGGA